MSDVPQQRKVSWGEVIGGILLALITGIFVVLGAFLAGIFLIDQTKAPMVGAAVAAMLPAVIYVPAFLLFRRRMPDFARGLLIGGCIVMILGGLCNGVTVGSIGTNGFH